MSVLEFREVRWPCALIVVDIWSKPNSPFLYGVRGGEEIPGNSHANERDGSPEAKSGQVDDRRSERVDSRSGEGADCLAFGFLFPFKVATELVVLTSRICSSS